MLTTEPDPGHCHLLEFEITANTKDKTRIETRMRFARGAKEKFAITCRLPLSAMSRGTGRVSLDAEAARPFSPAWQNPSKNRGPLSLADPRKIADVASLGRTVRHARRDSTRYAAPLDQYSGCRGVRRQRALRIAVHEKYPGKHLALFSERRKNPVEGRF